jgi:hypothetical protein
VIVSSDPLRRLIYDGVSGKSHTKLTIAVVVVAALLQTRAPTGKYFGPEPGLLLSNPMMFQVSGVTVNVNVACAYTGNRNPRRKAARKRNFCGLIAVFPSQTVAVTEMGRQLSRLEFSAWQRTMEPVINHTGKTGSMVCPSEPTKGDDRATAPRPNAASRDVPPWSPRRAAVLPTPVASLIRHLPHHHQILESHSRIHRRSHRPNSLFWEMRVEQAKTRYAIGDGLLIFAACAGWALPDAGGEWLDCRSHLVRNFKRRKMDARLPLVQVEPGTWRG